MAVIPSATSVIAVPQFSTLTDALQRRRGVTPTDGGGRDVSFLQFPADPELWRAIAEAVPHTSGAQDPPLYELQDQQTGNAIAVNEHFVRDFVEAWEDSRTHIITVHAPGALRTFRAGTRFWEFVHLWTRQYVLSTSKAGRSGFGPVLASSSAAAADGPSLPPGLAAVRVSITSNLAPREVVQLSLDLWSRLVHVWNDQQAHLHPSASRRPAAATDVYHPSQGRDDGSEAVVRDRSDAVIDPATTMDDEEIRRLLSRSRRHRRRRPSGSGSALPPAPHRSRYWTHFMSQWKILLAEHRNYLV